MLFPSQRVEEGDASTQHYHKTKGWLDLRLIFSPLLGDSCELTGGYWLGVAVEYQPLFQQLGEML